MKKYLFVLSLGLIITQPVFVNAEIQSEAEYNKNRNNSILSCEQGYDDEIFKFEKIFLRNDIVELEKRKDILNNIIAKKQLEIQNLKNRVEKIEDLKIRSENLKSGMDYIEKQVEDWQIQVEYQERGVESRKRTIDELKEKKEKCKTRTLTYEEYYSDYMRNLKMMEAFEAQKKASSTSSLSKEVEKLNEEIRLRQAEKNQILQISKGQGQDYFVEEKKVQSGTVVKKPEITEVKTANKEGNENQKVAPGGSEQVLEVEAIENTSEETSVIVTKNTNFIKNTTNWLKKNILWFLFH